MSLFPPLPEASDEVISAINREVRWCAPVMAIIVLLVLEVQSPRRYVRIEGYILHLGILFTALLLVYTWVERRVLRYLLVPARSTWGISSFSMLLGVLIPFVFLLPALLLASIGYFPLGDLFRQERVHRFNPDRQAQFWVAIWLAGQFGFFFVNRVARNRITPLLGKI